MKLTTTLILLIIFCSCSNTTKYLNKNYEDRTFTNPSLTVHITNGIHIQNKDDVTDDLGEGDPDEIFKEYFIKTVRQSLNYKSKFKNTDIRFNKISFKKTKKNLEHSSKKDESIYLELPEGKISEKDFALVLQSFGIHRLVTSSGYWSNGIYNSSSNDDLTFTFDFYLWDNNENTLVSYGRGKSSSSVFLAMGVGNWKSCIDSMINEIFSKTPFDKN
jgi:hypothetical protein